MRPLHALALLRTRASALAWMRALWCLGVLACEIALYRGALARCAWPDRRLRPAAPAPTHVLVIADAQVRHEHTRKHACRAPRLHDWFYHAGLRRNWLHALRLDPDAVIFLGDMLAGARRLRTDADYANAYRKFKHIFALEKDVPVFHVPGNEDVGLNMPDTDAVRRRYTEHFGALNSAATLANHTFVFLNAPGLVEEDYGRARRGAGALELTDRGAAPGSTLDFVHSVAAARREAQYATPAVLLTHIPLARPDGAGCGPLRERGTLRRGAGPGYQNMHTKRTSDFLLDVLRPALVLSADDRDYCEYVHAVPGAHAVVREATAKSFAPAPGLRSAGMHLLALAPPANVSHATATTLADAPCFLPVQERVVGSVYAPCALLTLLVLLVRRVRERRERAHRSPLPSFAFDEPAVLRLPEKAGLRTRGAVPAPVPALSFALPVKQAGFWRVCWKVLRLALADFVKVIVPAFALWGVVMWHTLR